MSQVQALLHAEGIEAGYGAAGGTGEGASQVLFGVDLSIQAGEVVTLLGRNGMGKSTTIKTLIGALPLRRGCIRFGETTVAAAQDGGSRQALRPDAIARLGVAIVPEGRQCFPNLSVEEHLIAFADHRNEQRDAWDLAKLYALFPRLRERRQHMGNQLSGGEQQMLAIARALSTNPRLLILDEATEGLAPVIREEIWKCLRQLKDLGQTILVVDKYIERLLDLADRHLVLERGRVVWQGDSAALRADRGIWKAYLGV
ncbi:ABC transporter ATP-binding protein [Hylemonella gracilis str. Niagara R]|uniref:ABC transporter ATP-binding protein n=1 Tax=Hylemonella gracilis str. Niagara R TaxID=1458275 RepID=A0A016XGA8_9BURK|nr:ABC transporter ATP-binding protein [Hylemonella gracilis]EYC51109.1 ABC transporter ATP-binding protein [Hylemonella gracilis str. Niagara R]